MKWHSERNGNFLVLDGVSLTRRSTLKLISFQDIVHEKVDGWHPDPLHELKHTMLDINYILVKTIQS